MRHVHVPSDLTSWLVSRVLAGAGSRITRTCGRDAVGSRERGIPPRSGDVVHRCRTRGFVRDTPVTGRYHGATVTDTALATDDPWRVDATDVARRLSTDPVSGLTFAESVDRLARVGPNRVESAPELSAWRRFLAVIIVFNGVLRFVQERKAERAAAALERKRMSILAADSRRGGRPLLVTKGAPDVLLALCTREGVGDRHEHLDDKRRAEIQAAVHRLADAGHPTSSRSASSHRPGWTDRSSRWPRPCSPVRASGRSRPVPLCSPACRARSGASM